MEYRCRQPAKQRFYNPRPVALAGFQSKVEMSETWACDDCWAQMQGTRVATKLMEVRDVDVKQLAKKDPL